ncbi:tripartite tricarboxylate transporter substrate binding protein [Bordetella holmesii]|uniref:Tripartite tricarboxylate transporter family receptor n=2 Tax=Bordetella holmesii TaxID=35814 RepID=A0A158M8N2_9BORD|nr:tripartite tricarboxylate transporter substrate binding protein [Bordetella holmesii]AHV94839.1 tripartite tricarboxylate transporter receptor family protein [Bordetella holmesii ATCC 51541]AIT25053.1 tripartite tricarboxylate transporter receptor family protein [Bordetella holmesii 44057]EWM45618.1 tripartite tricarboxylate transporter receptor family protein [Bordetella holmesii 70147]EWM48370.1 tripartite tricarboxylate transporter receptor family protein [Bordetella holmesii 41130]EWM49
MHALIINRRTRAGLAASALSLLGWGASLTPAAAESYPSKPLTVVVPFAAGGTVDKVARQLQQSLQDKLGQTVVIDNRGGAGGTIGTALVAKAPADGYTVEMVFDSYATEQHIYPRLPYSTEKDLTGVSYMVRSPMVLVVAPGTPYRSLADYVAAAKHGNVSYASVGPGSSNHLAAELFHQTAGSSGLHTPYRGGGPAITDLLGGHVESMIASLPLVLPHIQAGKLRALAVTAPSRVPALPQTPAVAESYPGFEIYSWVGMVAPAATPADRLDKLSQITIEALRDPAVAQRINESGFDVVAGGREEMNALVKSESDRWGKLIKAQGIVAQ